MIRPSQQVLQGEMTVGFENTITEQDLDTASKQFLQGLPCGSRDVEPDLDIDGLSDSVVARVKRFLSFGRV